KNRGQDAEALARLARISLIATRRRLAVKPELMRPPWAAKPVAQTTRCLLLAHRWNESSEPDRQIVEALTAMPYASLAADIAADTALYVPFLARVDGASTCVS